MRLAALSAVLTASLVTTLLSPIDATAAPGDLLETSRTNVNVRANPTTDAAIVATINPGEKIIELSKEGDWYRVNLPDRAAKGWVLGSLIDSFSVAPETASKRLTRAGHTTAAAYNPNLSGNPAKGEAVFVKCGACHTTVPGVHAQGPSLVGIFGRAPASASGFSYSGALHAFARDGAVWDEATLDRFIQRPGRVVKGTTMPYSGLRNPQDRRDVIAFLEQLSR